jgi:hypothetical protein
MINSCILNNNNNNNNIIMCNSTLFVKVTRGYYSVVALKEILSSLRAQG